MKKILLIVMLLFVIFILGVYNIFLVYKLNNINTIVYSGEEYEDCDNNRIRECNYEKSDIPLSKQDINFIQRTNEICVKDVVLGYADGISMNPTLGGSLLYTPYKDEELQRGDIVIYRDFKGELISHRIIDFDGDEIITKGDNNQISDLYKITKEDVKGIVKCTCYN